MKRHRRLFRNPPWPIAVMGAIGVLIIGGMLVWPAFALGVDTDMDGFTDNTELALGSDLTDAASKPESAVLDVIFSTTLCSDGLDNDQDSDGLVDEADPGCLDSDTDFLEDKMELSLGSNPFDPGSIPEHLLFDTAATDLEIPISLCTDGVDNDGDGLTDAADPGCASTSVVLDSDSDGKSDALETSLGSDTSNPSSKPEHFSEGTCGDGVDNDGDGLTDAADPGCTSLQFTTNGNFETGDLTGFVEGRINGGFINVVQENTCFGGNNTLGLTLNNNFAANIRSAPLALTNSYGILTSAPFVADSRIRFRALSENNDDDPVSNPVTFEVRVLGVMGNVLLSEIVEPNIVTLSPSNFPLCTEGDPRDGTFSTHIIDTSAFAGQAVRLQFRQHTNVAGKGFFTLVDDIEPVPCTEPPAGLVHWWTGDNNPYDIVGERHGIPSRRTDAFEVSDSEVEGIVGEATFSFAATRDVVSIVDVEGSNFLDPETSDFTIEAWIETSKTSGGEQTIVSNIGYHGGYDFSIEGCPSCNICFSHSSPYYTNRECYPSSITPGAFAHVAAVRSGTTLKLYVDGIQVGSRTNLPVSIGDGNSFGIGFPPLIYGTDEFEGLIDEVSFYNRALSDEDIQAIFNAGDEGKCRPTVAADSVHPTNVSAGGTVSTGGATVSNPVQTTVTSPNAGSVSIGEDSLTEAPTFGVEDIGQQVTITAPSATPENPLILVFRIDVTLIPYDVTPADIKILKDGVNIDKENNGCDGPGVAAPDPCVANREKLPDGDVKITVLTSTASVWTFGVTAYGDEGSAIALNNINASDLVGDPQTFDWTVNDPSCIFSDPTILNPTITCDDNGTFIATLTVNKELSNPVSKDATINVFNLPPSVDVVLVPSDPVAIADQPVNVIADFTDPGTLDTHTAVWNWNDGSTSPGTVDEMDGSSIVTGSHTYLEPGVYTVTVTVTDKDSDSGSFEATEFIVVYDSAGGFATGGGWIVPGGQSSDEGDFLPDLDGTSKATFGFVTRYKNGASTEPSGQLEFQYQVGDFNLHSAGYDWLVVTNNNWAKFQGLATINNSEELYPFRVDARDGDGNNGDRFIIKIWSPGADPDVEGLIYKASGDLGGGQIKIHNGQ